jgi:ABC-type transporter Mla subunit MlaD
MNRAETAKRSIVVGEQPQLTSLAESITQLQQLVNQIEQSAQALPSSMNAGTEAISRRLEPLAVAMTRLTDATTSALNETSETLKASSTKLDTLQTTSKTQAEELTTAIKAAQTDLARAQATWHQKIRVPWQALVIPPAISALLAAAATIGLSSWGQPPSPTQDQIRWQGIGHRVEQAYHKMNKEQQQQMIEALGLGKPTN